MLQNSNWRHFDRREKSFMMISRKISQSPEGMPMAKDFFEMTIKSCTTVLSGKGMRIGLLQQHQL